MIPYKITVLGTAMRPFSITNREVNIKKVCCILLFLFQIEVSYQFDV